MHGKNPQKLGKSPHPRNGPRNAKNQRSRGSGESSLSPDSPLGGGPEPYHPQALCPPSSERTWGLGESARTFPGSPEGNFTQPPLVGNVPAADLAARAEKRSYPPSHRHPPARRSRQWVQPLGGGGGKAAPEPEGNGASGLRPGGGRGVGTPGPSGRGRAGRGAAKGGRGRQHLGPSPPR